MKLFVEVEKHFRWQQVLRQKFYVYQSTTIGERIVNMRWLSSPSLKRAYSLTVHPFHKRVAYPIMGFRAQSHS